MVTVALKSPWVYTTTDTSGNVFSVTITFDDITGVILSVATKKDPGCAYNNFYIGTGPDGIPDSTLSKVIPDEGTSGVGVPVFNGFGFATISDVLAHQVTAGP